MIKQRNSFFTKTFPKSCIKQQKFEQLEGKKTRRSYLKFFKNPPHLTSIITNLQQNVRQLKNYHQSLQKRTILKMRKSSSLNEVNRVKSSARTRPKQSFGKNVTKIIKRYSELYKDKENISSNIQCPAIDSTVSKNCCQNGSTMLSVHNADVDEVKKAYQFAYGKETTNIVDLYHFFRKNADKSIRFYNHGQISTCPNGEQSEDLVKSRENIFHKKSTELLNVIIEDKSEKQQFAGQSEQKSGSFTVSKLSVGVKNPTMEEIFKGGCPDLANVYDFVKKRRISLKNYMNFDLNKNKEPKLFQYHQKQKDHQQIILKANKEEMKEKLSNSRQRNKTEVQEIKKDQNMKMVIESPHSPNFRINALNKKTISEADFLRDSEQKYWPSKSSKKSQKSSIKKSKKKSPLFNLDQNINTESIQEFNHSGNSAKQKNQRSRNILDENISDDLEGLSPCEKRYEDNIEMCDMKGRQQKMDDNSLDGCSISVKSSSRLIQLDFIPLDL